MTNASTTLGIIVRYPLPDIKPAINPVKEKTRPILWLSSILFHHLENWEGLYLKSLL